MFTLRQATTLLANLNLRSERVGEDLRLACDLALEVTIQNTALDLLHKDLRAALFAKDPGAQQAVLAIDGADWLPDLRFPALAKLAWNATYEGVKVTLHSPVAMDDDGQPAEILALFDAKLNKFTVECMTGGSVKIHLRVQAHPTQTDVAILASLIQREVPITIEPPTAEQIALKEQAKQKALEEAGAE